MKRFLLPAVLLLAVTLSATASDSVPSGSPQSGTAKPSYSRTGEDGTLIVSGDRWYLEEYDSLGRPVTGTFWTAGTVNRKTAWTYYGDAQQARLKVETGESGRSEVEYNEDGTILSRLDTDKDGKPVESLKNSYNDRHLLESSTSVKDGTSVRTEYRYTGEDKLAEKKVYRNDLLALEVLYTDEENWTETVYSKGVKVLVVTYEDGVRKK